MTIGALERWRSWLSRNTATMTTTASPATFAAHTDSACVGRSARRRRWIAMNVAAANPAMTSAANSQPIPTGMFLFITSSTALERIGIVPPSPMINSIAPCRPRK
jgi:hypothetical protein